MYIKVRDMVSNIVEDNVRKSYARRLKNKYDSLYDESVEWDKVVKAYEKQQAEENTRIAEENRRKSEAARLDYKHKNDVALAETRIKRLHGHLYQPDNMAGMIKEAKEALDACSGYSEYTSLKELFNKYKNEIESLPTYDEYISSQTSQTPVPVTEPQETETPVQTQEPQA